MKNASQFLSHSELQNRYDFSGLPVIILRNYFRTKKPKENRINQNHPQKSFNKNLPNKKSLQNCIYKPIINEKKEVTLNSQTKWLHDLLPHTTSPEINWKDVYLMPFQTTKAPN